MVGVSKVGGGWSGLVRGHVLPLLEDEGDSVDSSAWLDRAITSQELLAARVDVPSRMSIKVLNQGSSD